MPTTHPHSQQIMSSVGDSRFYQNKVCDDNGKVQISGYLWSRNPKKIVTILLGKNGQVALKKTLMPHYKHPLITGVWSDFDDMYSVRENVFKTVWDELAIPVQLCLSLGMGPVRPAVMNEEVLLTIGYAPDLSQEGLDGVPGWVLLSPAEAKAMGWGEVDGSTQLALQMFYGPMSLLAEEIPRNPLEQMGFVVNHVESQGYELPLSFYALTLEGRDQYDFEQGRALHNKMTKALREIAPCK